LTCRMAARDIGVERLGEGHIQTELLLPAIGDRRDQCGEALTQLGDDRRQWVGEVFVFALAEPVPRHHHPAAKRLAVVIERRHRPAFLDTEQAGQHPVTIAVEGGGEIGVDDLITWHCRISKIVTPAKAGTQGRATCRLPWAPASAGVTSGRLIPTLRRWPAPRARRGSGRTCS